MNYFFNSPMGGKTYNGHLINLNIGKIYFI